MKTLKESIATRSEPFMATERTDTIVTAELYAVYRGRISANTQFHCKERALEYMKEKLQNDIIRSLFARDGLTVLARLQEQVYHSLPPMADTTEMPALFDRLEKIMKGEAV